MSRGRYLSLEEARKSGQLERFAAEHYRTGNGDKFAALLDAMAAGKPSAKAGTSGEAASEDCDGTPPRQDK